MIIIDTREQAPLWHPPLVLRRKLDVGDYTTQTLMNRVHAERKSAPDLCGTMTRGHARFKRMILRAQEKGIKVAIFVECTEHHFLSGRFDGSDHVKMPLTTIHKIATTVSQKYDIPLFWCDGREDMKERMTAWFVDHIQALPVEEVPLEVPQ